MGHSNATYVIFDGDNDMRAYQYMRGWDVNKNIPFDFKSAHDLIPLRADAFQERTVKERLLERFKITDQVIVLIGEYTKNLYRFVRWEIEVALELDLPIIAVNLNGKRELDTTRCPPLLKDKYVVHVPFKARIIRYALDQFPGEYRRRSLADDQQPNRFYYEQTYKNLGITD